MPFVTDICVCGRVGIVFFISRGASELGSSVLFGLFVGCWSAISVSPVVCVPELQTFGLLRRKCEKPTSPTMQEEFRFRRY
jgi:hypothetical protein